MKHKTTVPLDPGTAMAIVGPTRAGKTTWVLKLLSQLSEMYTEPVPTKILYCYGIEQDSFKQTEHPNITFHQGMPTEDTVDELQQNTLIVLDDLSDQLVESKVVQNLIVRGCHHRHLTVVYMLHNLYEKGKSARTIALNCRYLVLFRNPRDMLQIHVLGRQMYPTAPNRLVEAYTDATSMTGGYLLVDNGPSTPERYRLRTQVFPEDDTVIYTAK